jgi:hypothetical protein
MELVVTKIGEDCIRAALFDKENVIAATYAITTLRDEDNQYQAAQYLVRQVRPQAGPHVAHEVSRMISDAIRKYTE